MAVHSRAMGGVRIELGGAADWPRSDDDRERLIESGSGFSHAVRGSALSWKASAERPANGSNFDTSTVKPQLGWSCES